MFCHRPVWILTGVGIIPGKVVECQGFNPQTIFLLFMYGMVGESHLSFIFRTSDITSCGGDRDIRIRIKEHIRVLEMGVGIPYKDRDIII